MEMDKKPAKFSEISSPEAFLDFFDISDGDVENIKEFGNIISEHFEEVIEEFYGWQENLSEFEHFFSDERLLAQVKVKQKEYWHRFFAAQVDESYLENRRTIGEAHARIGLSLQTYCGAMNQAGALFAGRLTADNKDKPDRAMLVQSVNKLANLDAALVISAYTDVATEAITAQSQALMEMSTPVTQIWEGILLLPIVGIIDSKRAQEIMTTTLAKISETQARVFIMDISGVAVVDTAVANHMIQVTKATRLMGCESTISGVSPAIAETIVQLGIDVGKVKTTANLKDALSTAFRRVGMEIREMNR